MYVNKEHKCIFTIKTSNPKPHYQVFKSIPNAFFRRSRHKSHIHLNSTLSTWLLGKHCDWRIKKTRRILEEKKLHMKRVKKMPCNKGKKVSLCRGVQGGAEERQIDKTDLGPDTNEPPSLWIFSSPHNARASLSRLSSPDFASRLDIDLDTCFYSSSRTQSLKMLMVHIVRCAVAVLYISTLCLICSAADA